MNTINYMFEPCITPYFKCDICKIITYSILHFFIKYDIIDLIGGNMKEKEKTLTLIKQILSDDEIDVDSKLQTLSNTVNYNSDYINKVADKMPKRNINIRIFSETEALIGEQQDLSLLDDINQVDQVRYIFSHEKKDLPVYLGRYDGYKDEFILTENGLKLFFPLGTEFVYSIIKKCKMDNSEAKSTFKNILSLRRRQAEYEGNAEKIVEDGMRKCVCCNMIYPLTEDYFSKVGGVIESVKKKYSMTPKERYAKRHKLRKEELEEERLKKEAKDIVISENADNSDFLNICKKCELVRVNEEFYRQRLRDKKGKWLRNNTLMSTNEILNYDIDKIPNLDKVGSTVTRVPSGVTSVTPSGTNASRKKIRCVETGKIFADAVTASSYLDSPYNSKRILMALDNPDRIAAGYHWVTIEMDDMNNFMNNDGGEVNE